MPHLWWQLGPSQWQRTGQKATILSIPTAHAAPHSAVVSKYHSSQNPTEVKRNLPIEFIGSWIKCSLRFIKNCKYVPILCKSVFTVYF